jgi:hypothetical protein
MRISVRASSYSEDLLRPPANYVRPCKGGLILGGYEADPVQYDMAPMPEDFTIDRLALDLGVLRRLAHFDDGSGARSDLATEQ